MRCVIFKEIYRFRKRRCPELIDLATNAMHKQVNATGPAAVKPISRLRVSQAAGSRANGWLTIGTLTIPCKLGPAGIVHRKVEGDGATPAGSFHLYRGFYRPDRLRRPRTAIPLQPQRPSDGWCDDRASGQYNRPVPHPSPASHEAMWRDDPIYDVVLILDHNHRPRVRGAGSAIFFHLTRTPPAPTAGCVAISAAAMRRLLPRLARDCRIEIA